MKLHAIPHDTLVYFSIRIRHRTLHDKYTENLYGSYTADGNIMSTTDYRRPVGRKVTHTEMVIYAQTQVTQQFPRFFVDNMRTDTVGMVYPEGARFDTEQGEHGNETEDIEMMIRSWYGNYRMMFNSRDVEK